LHKLQQDFAAAQLEISEQDVRKKMRSLMDEVQAALAQETPD